MCMKYINANAMCFKSLTMNDGKIISYNAPFTGIRANRDAEELTIENFIIVTAINILGTNNEDKKIENPLEQGETIEFIIRLTKCDRIEENRIGVDLDKFSLDLQKMKENNQINTACFDFLDYTRIINVKSLSLPGGTGKYVIKILTKRKSEDEYSVQAMTPLEIQNN